MIKFLLNNDEIQLDDFPADLTVLEYLRTEKNLCGTKEGCASGDCGACTVVLASPVDNKLEYSSVNSCITFVGALHGKQLLTVEHLRDGETLHPVQQAMVTHHGSQCGFCTPGFVMSMFALYKTPVTNDATRITNHQIDEGLAGNLCRCTGYKPIIAATKDALTENSVDQFNDDETGVVNKLEAIVQESTVSRKSGFFIPQTLSQLADHLVQNPQHRLLGGGTDLALEVTQKLITIDSIVLLKRVPELNQIEETDSTLEIGAAVSLNKCKRTLTDLFPEAAQLLLRFGSTQVRNQGTIGGNIATASPIGDLPPVLLALDAGLVLQHGTTTRRINIEDFFLGYRQTALQAGEFIRSIIIDKPAIPGSRQQLLKVYKVSKRIDDDISAVCLAAGITLESDNDDNKTISSIRIGCGGMAAIPCRANSTESVLINGDPGNPDLLANAVAAIAEDFSPIDDARASAGYRTLVSQNLLRKLMMELNEPGLKVRVEHVS